MSDVRYELWSELRCNGGVREAVIPRRDLLDRGPEVHRNVKTGEHALTLPASMLTPVWSLLREEKVVQVIPVDDHTAYEEFRLRGIEEQLDDAGTNVGELTAEGVRFDLHAKAGLVRRVEGDGTVRLEFDVQARTVTEYVQLILGLLDAHTSGAPAYFSVGTVESTERFDMAFRADTPYEALQELAEVSALELDVTRNGETDYQVHLLEQIGAGNPKPLLKYRRNVLGIRHESRSEDQATRVFVEGERGASIAENGWTIAAISGSQLTFEEEPVLEDGQLDGMGLHARKPDGTVVEVTASTAPDKATLADVTGLNVGDVITFVADSAGAEASHLDSPSRINGTGGAEAFGVLTRKVRRRDVPPINNLAPNPVFLDWTAGLPDGVGIEGAPTVQRDTNELNFQSGDSSVHVIAAVDEGVFSDQIAVSPTARAPHFSCQIRLFVVSGSVRLEFHDETDVTDPNRTVRWPPDRANFKVNSTAVGRWIENLAYGVGEDFGPNGQENANATAVRIKVLAEPGGAEWYLDMWQVTQTAEPFRVFFPGRASNVLWLHGNRELLLRRDPLSTWRLDPVIDLTELAPDTWPDEELVPGGESRIKVAEPVELDVDGVRIVGLRRLPSTHAVAELEVETELEMLTRRLAASERRRRRVEDEVPEQTTRPDCVENLSAVFLQDLFIDWDRAIGAARYEGRVAGSGETDADKWANGTRLFVTDTDFWVEDGDSVRALALLDEEIMVRSISKHGLYDRCFPTAEVTSLGSGLDCPNLGPADSLGEYCVFADETPAGEQDIHEFELVNLLNKGLAPGDEVSWGGEGKVGAATLAGAGGKIQRIHEGFLGSDLFDRDELGGQWTVLSGRWSIVGLNRLRVADPGGFSTIRWTGLPNKEFGVIQARMRRRSLCDAWVGAAMQVTGAKTFWSYEIDHNQLQDCATTTDRQISMHHYAAGTLDDSVYGSLDTGWADDAWYWLQGGIQNHDWEGGIVGFLNGADGADFTDDNNFASSYGSGGFGLQAKQWHQEFSTTGNPEYRYAEFQQVHAYEDWTIQINNVPTGVGVTFRLERDASFWGYGSHTFTWSSISPVQKVDNGDGTEDWYFEVHKLFPYHRLVLLQDSVELDTLEPAGGIWGGDIFSVDLDGGLATTTGDCRVLVELCFLDEDQAVITGECHDSSDTDANEYELIQGTTVIPDGAVFARFTARRVGAGDCDACFRDLQFNRGPNLCVPGGDPSGLPPVDVEGVLHSVTLVVDSVDTCAGGAGVQLTTGWTYDEGEIDDVQWRAKIRYFEEADPAGAPGDFTLVHEEDDILPSAQTHTVSITEGAFDQAGTLRGTDGSSPQSKRWVARVWFYDVFEPHRVASESMDSLPADPPAAYDTCP